MARRTAAGLSRRVLLVDHDLAFTAALRAVLTRRGWEVTVAATVADALAQLDGRPHCVVLDLALPDGSGIEVLERIIESGEHPVRTVVATAVRDAAVLKRVRQYEPDALLRKPIDLVDLLQAIDAG